MASDKERLINSDEYDEEDKKRWHDYLCCCIPTRYVIVVWGFLGFMIVYTLRINLSIALTVMVNNTAFDTKNQTKSKCYNTTNKLNLTDGPFMWDQEIQGLINSAFFWGYIPLQIPAGWLGAKVGGKWLFGVGVLWTALLTLLTPLAAKAGYEWLIALRVLEGAGESITYPGIHTMLGYWAPVMEISVMGGIIYSGSLFGLVVGLITTAYINQWNIMGGWPAIFYIHGIAGIIWFLIWTYVAHSTPAQHPRISNKEKTYIESSIEISSEVKRKIPWFKIFFSIRVLAISVANFSAMWSVYTLMTSLPQYFKFIQGFNLEENGLVNALPYLLSVFGFIIAGRLADIVRERKWLNTTNTRKLFNTIGGVFNAAFIIALSYITCNKILVITFLCIAMAIGIFNTAGYNVNHIDLAPQYAGILLGITNSVATVSGIVGPYLTGAITNNNENEDSWRIVFFISSGVTLFGTVFYLIFGSGERQSWAIDETEIQIYDESYPNN